MSYDDDDDGDSNSKNLRKTWVFCYKPGEVLEAARKKLQYHKDRVNHWLAQAVEAEQKLKDKGFEYRHRENTLGRDLQIIGDPQLAEHLTHCRRKVKDHKLKQDVFECWERALAGKAERQPGEELELKIGDVLFFGL